MSSFALKQITCNLKIPVMAAPMFIVSTPNLVIEQCKSGIIGSFPALNARGDLDKWLQHIHSTRSDLISGGLKFLPPFAVNQIVHPTNKRLFEDMEIIVKNKVPIVITSLGARKDINNAVHSYGGIVFHDVTTNTFAKKAIEKGADGLVAVAAGAGGHAGGQSPFALMQEIREWYDGPVALSGAISNGVGIAAAQKLGADLAYIGSPFIATHEANASYDYKQMIVDSTAEDIVYTDYFTGIKGNYLKASIKNSGVDIDSPSITRRWLASEKIGGKPKPWSTIWGCGQGISNVKQVIGTDVLVQRLSREYKLATQ